MPQSNLTKLICKRKITITLPTIVNVKRYLSAGTLLKLELSRSQIKQKLNTSQNEETKFKSFYWRCFWLQRICSDWTRASKEGTAREKIAFCILNLLLDFESYLKNSSKKLQFFFCQFITVKATCTVPKAVAGLSHGSAEISHFSTRRKFCFLTTPRMGWWSTSRKSMTA